MKANPVFPNIIEHTENTVKHRDGKYLPHPRCITQGMNDEKWPAITYEDIFNYFVLSLGVDGSSMRNYKALRHMIEQRKSRSSAGT